MDITDYIETIKSKEDFIKFLDILFDDFIEKRQDWANPNIESYIIGMKRYLLDHTEQSLVPVDFTPSWKMFADLMIGASIYE